MTDWQDISTAPRDGTIVLGGWKTDGDPSWAMYPVLWRKSKMYRLLYGWHMIDWPDMQLQLAINPTHWMPLPEPPEDTE